MREPRPGAGIFFATLLASLAAWPGAAVSQEAGFDFERFQCNRIHREGKTLEMEPPILVQATAVFSCVKRSCVHRERVTAADGTRSDVFMSVYIPDGRNKFVFTKAMWTADEESPVVQYGGEYPFGVCAKLNVALDKDLWAIDLGKIRYEGDEVHANPDYNSRPSYFFAPTRYHGDWSEFHAIAFDLESSGGRYLPAYHENILGDVVLENGNLIATYEIPKYHDGKWHSVRVPLDGAAGSCMAGRRRSRRS